MLIKTKTDWETVKEEIDLFSSVDLMIDGYQITITMQRHKMKLLYVVYVNGVVKGEWLTKDCEERRRFLQKTEKYLHNKNFRDNWAKKFGKKSIEKDGINKKITGYGLTWGSWDKLRFHLSRNNENIELVEDDTN